MASRAASTQRCDLVSLPDTAKCIDFSKLAGASLTVNANTTRIPINGLSICGLPAAAPEPVDIVYAVDQTNSMIPTAVFAGSEDTSGWYDCNFSKASPVVKFTGSQIDFHGNSVKIIDPTTPLADILSVCTVAGDPYNVRVAAMQNAIKAHAVMTPASYAGTSNFGPGILSSQPMTSLSTSEGINTLVSSLALGALSGTNYEMPLTWGRIQLFGGKSATRTIPSSAHADKAIIILTDGTPTKGTWQNFLDSATTVQIGDTTWSTASDSIPPVYGIFMGVNGQDGAVLKSIATATKGAFYQIPPNMPDSLALVIKQIQGSILKASKPDTLRVTNRSNGQTSIATTSVASGNSFRMTLDSLVGLETGPNDLQLVLRMGGKTATADWNVTVSDDPLAPPSSLLDKYLTTNCGTPSSLALRPDLSGLPWADTADRNILTTLTTHSEGLRSLPVSIRTAKSTDLERVGLAVPTGSATDASIAYGGSIAWQNLSWTNSVPGDAILRSGPGWDTAIATFTMPRDRRDTASARLALRHLAEPGLSMTPQVEGPSGRVAAEITDPNLTGASVRMVVRGRAGDSLPVSLERGTDGTYRGSFEFRQGQAFALSDTVLDLGPRSGGTDTLFGTYQNLSATTLVVAAIAKLRFLDAAGQASDTLALSMLVGDSVGVTVEAWLGGSPCTGCAGFVSIKPSTTGIGIRSTQGSVLDSVRLVSGRASVVVKGLQPTGSGAIAFRHDSLGASITARPVRIEPIAPDSVVYLDADGDGALDRVVLHSQVTLSTQHDLYLPWPDSAKFLDWRSGTLELSTDSKTASYDLNPVSQDTTVARSTLRARWRWDASWPWQNVTVIEHIAPVPMRALLVRGRTMDTLRVSPSEKLWPSLSPADSALAKIVAGSVQKLSPRSARIETSTGALLLLFPSDSSFLQIVPGDSVRFLTSVKDVGGNVPGKTAKAVVVQGTDPAPRDAFVTDSDADGRADRVVVRLSAQLTVTDQMGFLWPDSTGSLSERWLPVSEAKADSGGRILTFDLDPWEFGSTQCPADGCAKLGWMGSTQDASGSRIQFTVRDGVDPIPFLASYRFSATGTTSDTLLVRFSESMRSAASGDWISTGRPSIDSLGTLFVNKAKPRWISSREAAILVDSTFAAKVGDSLRIAFPGSLSDSARNAPDTLAYWTPIRWGQPPPKLTISLLYPVVYHPITDAPSRENPITVVVRNPTSKTWTAPDGEVPTGIQSRFGGPIVQLNRIPQDLGLYIYDNLGVSILSQDLSNLARMESSGNLSRTRRGDFEIWLAWNGKDALGNPVPSGVYTFRVTGRLHDGRETYVLNTTINQGIFLRSE
jgi:hypothetical protein